MLDFVSKFQFTLLLDCGKSTKFAGKTLDAVRQCWVLWSIEYGETGTEYEFYDYMRESRCFISSLNFNLHSY